VETEDDMTTDQKRRDDLETALMQVLLTELDEYNGPGPHREALRRHLTEHADDPELADIEHALNRIFSLFRAVEPPHPRCAACAAAHTAGWVDGAGGYRQFEIRTADEMDAFLQRFLETAFGAENDTE
jgi:hypothetical protein